MPEQNLNPNAVEAGAKALFLRERKYHTPSKECPEPPNWEDLTKFSKDHYRGNVRAVLSALPAQPDTVNSVEELDALPCASVVLNGVTAFQKYGAREPFDWSADGRWYDSTQVELPARVLYRPTEEATNGR